MCLFELCNLLEVAFAGFAHSFSNRILILVVIVEFWICNTALRLQQLPREK